MTKVYREDGLNVVEIDGKYSIISEHDQLDLFELYDGISSIDKGLVEVIKDFKAGLVDINGKIILNSIYDGISPFDENGLSRIMLNKKEGLFSYKKGWVVEPQYTAIYPAYNNVYVACKDGTRNDYPQICIYNSAYFEMGEEYRCDNNMYNSYSHSLCSRGEYGIIDANGVTLLDFVYDKILYFNNGYAPIKRNNKWGIINTECKFILPMEYDRIRAIYNSRFIVQKGNSIFELDSDGDIKTDITN